MGLSPLLSPTRETQIGPFSALEVAARFGTLHGGCWNEDICRRDLERVAVKRDTEITTTRNAPTLLHQVAVDYDRQLRLYSRGEAILPALLRFSTLHGIRGDSCCRSKSTKRNSHFPRIRVAVAGQTVSRHQISELQPSNQLHRPLRQESVRCLYTGCARIMSGRHCPP